MLLRESYLTFERIAHEWARELDDAKKPGRLNRDEIFLNMVCGVWRGQFANTVLTIEQAFRDDKDGQKFKPLPLRVTRETLDKVVVLRPGVRPRDPDASRWEFLASLKLGQYDEPLFLRVYLEPLTISKEDFGRWCDEQGHQRPQFWFGEQADTKKRRKAGRGRKPGTSPYAEKDALLCKKMVKLIKDGKSNGCWNASDRVAEEAEGVSFESKRMRLYRKCKRISIQLK